MDMCKEDTRILPLHLEIKKANKTYTFYNEPWSLPHTDIIPYGCGIESAVLQLGEYPSGTQFNSYDQFDGLTLFEIKTNEGSEYLSIWDKDLIECYKKGYIRSDSIEIKESSNDDYFYMEDNFRINFSDNYMIITDSLERAAETCHKAREIFFQLERRKEWTEELLPKLLDGHYYEAVFKTTVMLEELLKKLAFKYLQQNYGSLQVQDYAKETLFIKDFQNMEYKNITEVEGKMYGKKLITYALGEKGVLYNENVSVNKWNEIYEKQYNDLMNYFDTVRNVYCHNIRSESEYTVIKHLKRAIAHYERIEKLGKRHSVKKFLG
jgi:hypothetical protein